MERAAEVHVVNFALVYVAEGDLGRKIAFQMQGESETGAYIKRAFEMFVSDFRRSPKNSHVGFGAITFLPALVALGLPPYKCRSCGKGKVYSQPRERSCPSGGSYQ